MFSQEDYPWRATQTLLCRIEVPWKLFGTRIFRHRSAYLLFQWALGSCWCIQYPASCEWSVSVVPGQLRHWLYSLFHPPPRPESNQVPLGHHVLLHPPLPRHTTGCPGADWCPNPGLGGDPPGDHLSSYQTHAQIFVGSVFRHRRYKHYWATVWVVLSKFDPVSDLIFPIWFSEGFWKFWILELPL